MVTPEVIPVKFGDPSTNSHVQNRKDTVTPTERAPASLSLEIVKDIWRKYPKVPTPLETGARSGSATVVQPTAPAAPNNALELNLGARTDNEVLGGSPSTSPPPNKSDGLSTGVADRQPASLTVGSVQTESPASERAVDELLPVSSDNMEIVEMSSAVPNDTSQHSLQLDEKEGDRLLVSTSPTLVSPSFQTGARSIQDVRSMLLDLTWKAAQRRHPDKNITYEQFSAQFAQKMSDVEVRDFLQTGKVVIEGLRRSGQLEEAKRKYMSEDNEDEQRRTRRRLESSSQRPVAITLQDRGSISGSTGPSPSPSMPLNTMPPVVPKAMFSTSSKDIPPPRAPRAMLSNNWKDAPAPRLIEPLAALQHTSTPQPEEQSSPCRKLADDRTPTSEVSHLAPSLLPVVQPTSIPPPTADSTTNDAVDEASSHAHDPPSGTHDIDGHAASTPPSENKPLLDSGAARILLAKAGLSSMGLLNASFDLDGRLFTATRRWAERSTRFDPTDLNMKLYLIAISTTAAQKAFQEPPPDAQPSFIAEKVSQLDVIWPQLGTLYVSLNKDRPESISWTGTFFGPSSPALDISGVVVEGTNEIQFVQFEDHSHTLFVVLAIQPNGDELQETMTLHSRRKSWVQLSRNYQNKTHVKLQFDASSAELVI